MPPAVPPAARALFAGPSTEEEQPLEEQQEDQLMVAQEEEEEVDGSPADSPPGFVEGSVEWPDLTAQVKLVTSRRLCAINCNN